MTDTKAEDQVATLPVDEQLSDEESDLDDGQELSLVINALQSAVEKKNASTNPVPDQAPIETAPTKEDKTQILLQHKRKMSRYYLSNPPHLFLKLTPHQPLTLPTLRLPPLKISHHLVPVRLHQDQKRKSKERAMTLTPILAPI
ncbi:unnamed protein product [Absidia cylindrospora]